MILKNVFFYLSIIFLNFFAFERSTILFPFKIISSPYLKGHREDKNRINNKIDDSSKFFDSHYVTKKLSLLKLGSPPKSIISHLEIFQDYLLIKDSSNESYELFGENEGNSYQYKNSLSFKNLTEYYNSYQIKKEIQQYIGEDDLFLFREINNIKEGKYSCFHNYKFDIRGIKSNDNFYNSLSIGFCLDNESSTNFIRQSYNRKIISSLLISFEYNLENIIKGYDGMIILGKYPHQILPDIYKEEDFISFYSNQPNIMRITNFFLSFDEINSINNNKIKTVHKNNRAILSLNSGLITGTSEYLDFIENNFFGKYYKLNICHKYKTKTEFISDFIIISCDNIDKLKFEEFPNLNFVMNSENLIFEFTYKDLFLKVENKYYFLVVFETNNIIWNIGKPLLLKYTFVYNGEAKTIGFYKNRINSQNVTLDNNNKENIKIERNIGKIIIIFISFIIFIVLISFISYRYGKKYNFKRKILANELDENFEYNPNIKYKSFEKDVNKKIYNKEEKHLELMEK